MRLSLQHIDITGDPTVDELVYLPVRLTYSDDPDLDAATEFLQIQIKSPAAYGRVLAEVELDALHLVRELIDSRMSALKMLKGR
ncbi:hypothetical protein [Aminobacter aminovorans]|uniref:Uncharacterized protein n=1 Tax=Aminobacter aminovorans TaxID=83263 RepID=A0AAC9AQX6_AMIAI|nr:hypothetical protein [Aminobacter aminovorans]AMS41176.1 hypothetical protein AA2016_2248 [Aminobacter aminovorans]MBB3705841.1 hypothetical protein [Aminobacter aminovorans]